MFHRGFFIEENNVETWKTYIGIRTIFLGRLLGFGSFKLTEINVAICFPGNS